MTKYDAKQVCLNGHHITDRARTGKTAKEFCDKCGAETITECPNCHEMIKGDDLDSGVVAIGFEPTVPSFCENCGEPFPWASEDDEPERSQRSEKAEYFVGKICKRFPKVVRSLQNRYGERSPFQIDDEYDVQDILEGLLRIYFDDVRPEEYIPGHAGSSSRIDFLLKNEKIGIEVKMTRDGLDESEVGDELSTDKERYQAHPDCENLICFIYNPENILQNPASLKDLEEESDDLDVKVIISPEF